MISNSPSLATKQATLDGQTFQQFYREHLDPIYHYMYRKVGNREEAEDLTSQVFLKAVRHLDEQRGPYSMRKWLFQVAHTTVIDYWRSHYRFATASLEELLSDEESVWKDEPQETQAELAERVRRILEALPERYRAVLTCRFLAGLSIRDTAKLLGLTEMNVKVIQFRALKCAADLEKLES